MPPPGRGGRAARKLKTTRAPKYYKFIEPANETLHDSTDAPYWYEETGNTLSFLDPIEHLDYESSDEEGEVDAATGLTVNTEDKGDSLAAIYKPTQIEVQPPHTQWEERIDDESQAYYYFNRSTYETLWEKPYELVAAENLASKKARMSVIKERNKRQQRFLTQANKHTVAKASRLATKKAAMLTYQFEGFYAEKSTLHHAAVLLAETVHRRLSQLDIAARYYAKGSYDKAAASLVLSQRAGTRSLPALLALAHSHYLMWVSTFTYPSAFACDRAKEFTSPPPSTKLFRKRKQLLLSALEAYKQALPVSQISRVEDASINTSSPNTATSCSILLQSAKILNHLGDFPGAGKLLGKLFSQQYFSEASSDVSLMGGIVTWNTLTSIGGRKNMVKAGGWMRWVSDNVEEQLAHTLKVAQTERHKFAEFAGDKSNASRINNTTIFTEYLATGVPAFNEVYEVTADGPRALRVACLLVYSQMMVHVDKRADAMVALMDCYAYSSRGGGWTDEVNETPVQWFNSPQTWVEGAHVALGVLNEDGTNMAAYCYEQAIMRGDGSSSTMTNYAIMQFKMGKSEDALFTMVNVLQSHSYYDYRTRALLSAWSSPFLQQFEGETLAAEKMGRFGRTVIARKRMKGLRQRAQEQVLKDEENFKKLVEFWKHKDEGWLAKTYRKWTEYTSSICSLKDMNARKIQWFCKKINAKNELIRRRQEKVRVEGAVASNLAKIMGKGKQKYFLVWKAYLTLMRRERAVNRIQNFARMVIAKRKVRLERIIAMVLGKSSLIMRKQCFQAWRRWQLDSKLEHCASAIQRRYRGLIGRRRFLRERTDTRKKESLIALALGKSSENLVKRIFLALKDDWTYEKLNKAVLPLQRLAKCFLAKRLLVRKKRQEAQVKEMAFLIAGKNTERLQRKFIALILQGVMDKAAAKFQSIFRGKKGRNAAEAEKDKERRIRILARRCMGGAGHMAIDGWKAYITMVRIEKKMAATKLQNRWRMKLSKRKLKFELAERNRKEELIVRALGKNLDRLMKAIFRAFQEQVEEKHGATALQGLWRKKQAKKDVKMLADEKRRKENIIAMALGRHDLRLSKYTVHRWLQYTNYSKTAAKVVKCYRVHVAKTILVRMKLRREKRRKAILNVFHEYKVHMLSLGMDKMQAVVRSGNAAETIQRFARFHLKRIRAKRVHLVSSAVGAVLMGLSRAVTIQRYVNGRRFNLFAKLYLARAHARFLRAKKIREAEIFVKCKVVRERRIQAACRTMWKEIMVVWKLSYGVLQMGFRCALARRERLRRVEYERLLNVRCEVYMNSRRDRLLTRVFQALELQVLEKYGALNAEEEETVAEVAVDDASEAAFGGDDGEDSVTRRFSKLPKIPTLVANQISLEQIKYNSPTSLKPTKYALNKHMDRSRNDTRCSDAQSGTYWRAFKKVQKTGVFEISCNSMDGMTKPDFALLVRACHVLIMRGAGQSEVDQLSEILANCWCDDDDEILQGVVSLRKIIIIGKGRGEGDKVENVEKLFCEVLKKKSELVSFSMTGINVGNMGLVELGKRLSLEGRRKGNKKLRHLQELVLDGVGFGSYGAACLLAAINENSEIWQLKKISLSRNFVGDHPYVAGLVREFVFKQMKLVRLELVACGLGTYTEGGWQDDNVASGVWAGISDIVKKCRDSMEDELQVSIWRDCFKDVLMGENAKVGDGALLSLGREIQRVWAPAAKYVVKHGGGEGGKVFIHVENLELRDCSITSRGAGGLAEQLMKVCVEGGMYGEEGLVRRLGLERNCIQDEGAGALDELVRGVGCEVLLDGNLVSDEVVRAAGEAAGGGYYDMSVCLFPETVWNKGCSGLYAGRGSAFKLPELEWTVDDKREKLEQAVEEGVRREKELREKEVEGQGEGEVGEEEGGVEEKKGKKTNMKKEEQKAAFSKTTKSIFEVREGMEKARGLGEVKWWQGNSPGPKRKGGGGGKKGEGLSLLTDFAELPEWAALSKRELKKVNMKRFKELEKMAQTV